MTYSLFRTIGIGSVQELLLTLDPTKNYRFKMNASNKDGTSPWSNVVEWGAERLETAVFAIPPEMAIAKYSDAVEGMSGIWFAQMTNSGGVKLEIRQYPFDWTGDTNQTAQAVLVMSNASLIAAGIGTPDANAFLTFYQVTGPTPLSTHYMVMKYQSSGGGEPVLFLVQGTGTTITVRKITVTLASPAYDFIVMEDGVLLVQHDVGEGIVWDPVPPTSPGSLSTLSYDDANAIAVGSPTATPYLKNLYPLVFTTTYVNSTTWFYPEHLTTLVATNPWDIQAGWVPDSHLIVLGAQPVHADWNLATVKARYGVSGSTFLQSNGAVVGESGIVLYTSQPDAADLPPIFLLTNTAGWKGSFVIDDDLYVWGRGVDARVLQAPETLQDRLDVVNLHRMRFDQSTGLVNYSDVGSNLLVFNDAEKLIAIENTAVIPILGIGVNTVPAFNHSVEVLSDKSIVVRTLRPPTFGAGNVTASLSFADPIYTVHVDVALPEYTTTHILIDSVEVAVYGPNSYPIAYDFDGTAYSDIGHNVSVQTTFGNAPDLPFTGLESELFIVSFGVT